MTPLAVCLRLIYNSNKYLTQHTETASWRYLSVIWRVRRWWGLRRSLRFGWHKLLGRGIEGVVVGGVVAGG